MTEKCKSSKPAICIAVIAALLALILSTSVCFAEVISTTEETGPADYIYVAGNPDLYPVEYYDKETESYKGLMPELLEKVSESTGLSFAYVNAGAEDSRLELARNYQVEMVTAFEGGDFNDNAVPMQIPVFTATIDDREVDICIGFTQIASEELQKEIIGAFESIPDSEIANMAISYSINNAPAKKTIPWIFILIVAVLAIIAAVILILISKKKKNETIKTAAMTDMLTGLGNSDYYSYSFENFISRQIRDLYYVAYISMSEARKRKLLNDEEALEIQKYVGQRLGTAAASTEYASRIGDGTFSFVFQSSNREEAEKRIKETVNSINAYLGGFNEDYAELFSAGICSLAENPDCNAEFSLTAAKQGYLCAVRQKLLCAFSEKSLLNKNIADEKLRRSVDKAIENKEFKIFLQFINERQSGKICGAEVLSRWDNPERGMLTPAKYIEILRESGSIGKHDYYIFENLCILLESWENTVYRNLFLNCNFTRISVSEKNFADRIEEISARHHFDHSKLVIEITEDSLTEDIAIATYNISRCKEMGFKVAIDDIGSGFSSISDLSINDIDLVKVDREIVISGVNEKGFKLLSSLISLAHNMGASVLCEGIETEEQNEMILKTDCDFIQGYYYSRVLPYYEAMKFLNSKTL